MGKKTAKAAGSAKAQNAKKARKGSAKVKSGTTRGTTKAATRKAATRLDPKSANTTPKKKAAKPSKKAAQPTKKATKKVKKTATKPAAKADANKAIKKAGQIGKQTTRPVANKAAQKAAKRSPGQSAKASRATKSTVATKPAPAKASAEGTRSVAGPHLSVVIPVYNEEGILRGSVLELQEKLAPFGFSYEILLCENGSRDRTVELGKELESEHPSVRLLSLGEPNYGKAMKMGIENARGTFVICDEIDLLDETFYARALALLERTNTDLVVGSKAMVGSNDQRPLFRRTATRVYNGLLRTACQYQGTDTHGLKGFRRTRLLDTLAACELDKDVFASEFVIRAHRQAKEVVEIPFAVREKRPPSIRLFKRVPHVLRSVARLALAVRS